MGAAAKKKRSGTKRTIKLGRGIDRTCRYGEESVLQRGAGWAWCVCLRGMMENELVSLHGHDAFGSLDGIEKPRFAAHLHL